MRQIDQRALPFWTSEGGGHRSEQLRRAPPTFNRKFGDKEPPFGGRVPGQPVGLGEPANPGDPSGTSQRPETPREQPPAGEKAEDSDQKTGRESQKQPPAAATYGACSGRACWASYTET